MKKRQWTLIVFFSALVFLLLLATVFLTFGVMFVLFQIGFLQQHDPKTPLIAFAIVSVIIGTILTRVFGKRPLETIVEISDASKEVAKGNFEVRLDENAPAKELRELAHNFNIMTKELASTEMLRNDFIENVSHEFKTPLTAIEGYVTLLQKKDLSEEKRMEYTQKIMVSTKRLSSLVGNILLLSRLENQEIAISKSKFSLDEQVRESLLMLEDQWSRKNLDLDIDMAECDYVGSADLLAQVWQNLLSNAIKFAPEGGTVRIALHQVEAMIWVEISDNGPGIPSELQSRIFEKFYQGDTSRSSQGNGLGLALVKRIVDLHNGEIDVRSAVGKGSTFVVILPIASDENK